MAGDGHNVNGAYYQGVAPGVKVIGLVADGTTNMKAAFDWVVAHRTQYNIVAVNYLDQSGADESQFVGELQTLHSAGVVSEIDMTSGTPQLVVCGMEIGLGDIANVANVAN